MINIEELGNKICIIGCSSSGKSTLADSLSNKLNISAYHLDLLAHYPDTKWLRRPNSELITAHEAIIQKESWIIDGNYSVCMQERFDKASSIIWLDFSPISCAFRYVVRSLRNDVRRKGRLPGAQSEFSFFMLKQILLVYPKNRLKYQVLIEKSGKRVVCIRDMKSLDQCYDQMLTK